MAPLPVPVTQQQPQSLLVDQYGRPVQRELLPQYISRPTISGTRQAVFGHVTAGLTPQDMAGILIEADEGDPQTYLALAEEIEEKDLHYAAVLGTRKRQVSQLDMTVEAPRGADASNDPATRLVQEDLIDTGVIDAALFDMLDAVGKGFSLTETIWKLSGNKWGIDRLEHVEPRFVRFDRITRRIPLLIGDNGLPQPLAPYKFVYMEIKAKSGIPIRGGVARQVAWMWMFKNYTLKDWVQFIEVFGMPIRVGKYAPGTPQGDIDALLRAVISLASDAGCAIPSNMQIEFTEAMKAGGGTDVFEKLARYVDEQMSKIVLGQTGTTDTAPSGLGNTSSKNTHNDVRGDIERADAAALMAAINTQIVRPYVDLNLGKQLHYPWLYIGRPDEQDVQLMIDAAAKLVPQGLRVRAQDIRGAVGFSEPQDGDELLTPTAASMLGNPFAPGPTGQPPLIGLPKPSLATARTRLALLASEMVSHGDDAIARAAAEQAKGDPEILKPLVDQIVAIARGSKTPDQFRAHLRQLEPDMTPLADKLAMLTFQALAGAILGETI